MNTPNGMSGGLHFTHPYLAVVMGGGVAGMLAAAALSGHADVVVVEEETVSRGPASRCTLPHPRPASLLTGAVADTIEELLPGVTGRLLEVGARRLPPTADLAPAASRIRRRPPSGTLLSSSHDLLERVVREQVLTLPGVTLLDGAEAESLTGTAEDVTGVRIRETLGGEARRLDADLVVDATGRRSLTPERLVALGLPEVRRLVADGGFTCATRVFRAPSGSESAVLSAGHDATGQVLGRHATLIPIEDGCWLVTLAGAPGEEPSHTADGFVPFAREVGDGSIGELIAGAEPLSEVRLAPQTAGHRLRYEELASWPTGFVVLGDAVAAFPPAYDQGLSVTARAAVALRDGLHRHGLDDPARARNLQRTVGRLVHAPWALATGQGIRRPGAAGSRPSTVARLARGSVHRMLRPGANRSAARDGRPELTPPATLGTRPGRSPLPGGRLPVVSPHPLITPPPSTSLPSTALPPGRSVSPTDPLPGGPPTPDGETPSRPSPPADGTPPGPPPGRAPRTSSGPGAEQ
ncbi:FAD-dependent monooxygenase [Streptomyces catenulae]|uniref:FAD-dependent monooxygenase n=1 Tax=Streptomyces catenulae TaxID=66875 RepID=A0ABV2Z4J5_9ACTN|nr:FAD-dependent monooxygenase [Streptomyces catenulae]